MTLDWNSLRQDTKDNFEELCCQLARYELVPDNSKFVRKGTPDAGVECFWVLPDKTEWGWQAKWFPISPSSSQWGEIDDSVEKALEKHPNLAKYVICLPNNRSDARVEGQKSMLEKWNERVEKWKEVKNIDFEYWGSSEIEERLSKTEHSGRHKYFFDKNYLSDNWFTNKLDEAIASAGTRYTPELNVKLPIARKFETLGRTSNFYNHLKSSAKKISKEYRYGINKKSAEGIDFHSLDDKIKSILEILIDAEKLEQDNIDFSTLNQCSNDCLVILDKIFSKLRTLEREEPTPTTSAHYQEHKYENTFYHLGNLQRELTSLEYYSNQDSLQVANTGALLLNGDAGNGKTHLFCDVSKNRIKNNQPTLVIHGGHLNEGNPKQQILQELDLDGTFDDFLKGLECVAQAHNCRAIFMIDALNEGEGKKIWKKYLAELLEIFSRYPWIGIAVSVRTSYEEAVIPPEIKSNKLSKFTHNGFTDIPHSATKIFFDNNGIQRPSIPLFIPEFSNPLFLKILCKGLRDRGFNKIPKGLKGITSVYEFFVETINQKLSEYLEYPKHQKKVQKAIDVLVELFVKKDSEFLNYDDADNALQSIHSSNTLPKSLLHHLISEGILNEDLVFNEKKEREVVVRFAYERFGDNLLVQNILKTVKTKPQLLKLFNKSGKFGKYFDSQYSSIQYRGIVDAISIQLPEKFGIELFQLKPKFTQSMIAESFVDSLMWRHPSSIKKSTQLLIENKILKNKPYRERFLRVMLTITGDPENRFNALYLNKYLKKMDMATRDSIWSVFLHNEAYMRNNVVKRYIDWGWNGNKSNIDSESHYLMGLTLCWFLTSSNRHIRDMTTKALVSLLFERLDILRKIIKELCKCNDPYVVERLFAVAYGCVLKSNDKKQIKLLSNEIFLQIFKKGTPPPNLLLRDYAKGIIDYAIYKKIKIDVDYDKVTPPYKSDWIKYPTKKQIEKLRKKIDSAPEDANGGWSILSSLGSMGDFYRYTIGGNSNSFDWSNIPLLSNKKSREIIFRDFHNSITAKQKIPWKNYYKIITEKDSFKIVKKEDRKEVFGVSFEDNEFDEFVNETKKYFYKLLTPKQKRIFSNYIESYMEEHFNRKYSREGFDLHKFANWIIKRVFDLGWSMEKFGSFDRHVGRKWSSRSTNKPERIGKKYQWIAFEELLARVSDNFEFLKTYGERPFQPYDGVWQLWERDIDPSLMIYNTYRTVGTDQTFCWWIPFEYDAWEKKSNLEWIKDSSDLPNFKSILQVTNPKDGSEWFVLQCFYNSQQPISAEKDEYDTPRRDIFFRIDSYLLEKSQTEKCYNWGMEQTYCDQRFPQEDHDSHSFIGEFYWGSSVQDVINIGEPFWTDESERSEKLPAKVYVSTYEYAFESEYDCSMKGGLHITFPNKLLIEKMKLINNLDGTFIDKNNNIIAYDPSLFEKGPSAVLIKKKEFLEFLDNTGYNIIWQIIGQKMIMEGMAAQSEWLGELDIHGMYYLQNKSVVGNQNNEFVNREILDNRRKKEASNQE